MSKDNGGPAFPVFTPDMNVGDDAGPGMSLRDWFAGHASTEGYTFADANEASAVLGIALPADNSHVEMVRFAIRAQAALRYLAADAMLEARKASEPTP